MSDNDLSDGEQPWPEPRHFARDVPALQTDSDLSAASDDSDSEMGDDDAPAAQPAPVQPQRRQLPDRYFQVHPIMRLLANRAHEGRHATDTHEALVAELMRSRSLHSPAAIAAMKACPRDAFVPEQQRDEDAFLDAPLSLEGLGFNMSAPHMHATCLEALQLQPGHRVLDVGSGSGVLTACMAFMVGKAGSCMGIDVRQAAVGFSDKQVKQLEINSPQYAEAACSCTFDCHNVFIPAPRHLGKYDRVHVGASCPKDKLTSLIALLRPGGGMIVSPVAPSDLQAISLSPSGVISTRTISQVRFSDLEVPSELAVVMALLQEERAERKEVAVAASTFSDDVTAIHGDVMASSGSSGSDQSHLSPGSSLGRRLSSGSGRGSSPAQSAWPKRFSKLLRACSGSAGSSKEHEMMTEGDDEGSRSPGSMTPKPELRVGELGVADCALVGIGWRIPVHRAVLRARCEHVRARCESGMRDADSAEVHVPEHFSQDAAAAFVQYLYEDELDARMDAQSTAALLHTAHFFGAPHLVGLCDMQLSRELTQASGDDEGACESAAALLALADEAGLAHLHAVALDFIVQNYERVAATTAYAALTKGQTDLIAAEACQLVKHIRSVLHSVQGGDKDTVVNPGLGGSFHTW